CRQKRRATGVVPVSTGTFYKEDAPPAEAGSTGAGRKFRAARRLGREGTENARAAECLAQLLRAELAQAHPSSARYRRPRHGCTSLDRRRPAGRPGFAGGPVPDPELRGAGADPRDGQTLRRVGRVLPQAKGAAVGRPGDAPLAAAVPPA